MTTCTITMQSTVELHLPLMSANTTARDLQHLFSSESFFKEWRSLELMLSFQNGYLSHSRLRENIYHWDWQTFLSTQTINTLHLAHRRRYFWQEMWTSRFDPVHTSIVQGNSDREIIIGQGFFGWVELLYCQFVNVKKYSSKKPELGGSLPVSFYRDRSSSSTAELANIELLIGWPSGDTRWIPHSYSEVTPRF